MEKERFKITLADGTAIEGLTKNGSNFVSEVKIDESIFESNCAPMTITSSSGTKIIYKNGEFIQQAHYKGIDGYFLAFRDKSAEEIRMETMQAQIEYISMMTDVEI